MVQAISSEQELEQIVSENAKVCVKFTAEWCGPCRMIAPVLAELDRRNPDITCVEVDVDAHKDIARAHQVTSMPTFVFLLNGKPWSRVVGADVNAIGKKFVDLHAEEATGSTSGSATGTHAHEGDVHGIISKAKTDVLNSAIFYGEAELLNVATSDKSEDLRAIFDLTKPSKPVMSDTDSQLIVYIPLTNKVKVKSLFIKTRSNPDVDESQPASHLKIWPNMPNVISFEDATSGNFKPAHDAPLTTINSDGWAEVPLKYVLFQNVNSLQFFLDGEDEDTAISIEKIILLGSKGDSTEHTKLEKIE